MNIKVSEKKVNSFSVGNPASGLGDTIVGTYGPTKPGQCDQYQPPIDIGGGSGTTEPGGFDWDKFWREGWEAYTDFLKEKYSDWMYGY